MAIARRSYIGSPGRAQIEVLDGLGADFSTLMPQLSTAKTTAFGDRVPGIRWKAMPILSTAQRQAYEDPAGDGIWAGAIPELPHVRR